LQHAIITKMQQTKRIHSLDSLRALMMLLGLVLHSAITYTVFYYGDSWPLKDTESKHLINDFLVFLIHAFRMPIFFFISGFFGAMLFYERHPLIMIKNRIKRIVFPFVIFLLLLSPILVFVFGYTNAVFLHKASPTLIAMQAFANLASFLPTTTFHLWFLYYLILITGTSFFIGLLLKKTKRFTHIIKVIFDWIIQRPIVRILSFSVLILIILTILGTATIETSFSFIPNSNTFIYYLFFYLIGWLLFLSKHHLPSFVYFDWGFTILALILIVILSLMLQNYQQSSKIIYGVMLIYSSFVVCLFIFGLTGLFIRYGSNYSPIIRYISDASYWVYVIHLPFTAIVPALISLFPFHAIIKFLIVLVVSSSLCFVSYHYFIRFTFMGKFLNGRKYVK